MAEEVPSSPDIEWQTPRRCAASECVQVARHQQQILVRTSAAPQTIIRLSPAEWESFRTGVISGDFDDLG
jgi:hypothetical protein